jgi:non-lysosomal glucosylceramidase
VKKSLAFSPKAGTHFWSNGYAWGTCAITKKDENYDAVLNVHFGELRLSRFSLTGFGDHPFEPVQRITPGNPVEFRVVRTG